MRFDIMTLFPEFVTRVLEESIIGRAQKSGHITVTARNIRDYSKDKHRRVDDTPYGGGKGMLMMAPPIYDCYASIVEETPEIGKRRVIYMSPRGKVLDQSKARELTAYDQLIILCGHYEGVDARIIEEIVDEEISIGDFVLTGGELPACILIDAVARLVDGVLAAPECHENESLTNGLVEYPQYTRPVSFHGMDVPEVLLSGHHANIEKWRAKESLAATERLRPDLLKRSSEKGEEK
ncbi:MAG: tRNA (guanosine(37)-N1)-methyltransferase TrmD [Ruminococcaceae bacterium]|nr:tRNA (guanosine(37)-N1)-methyltransferase TrmD [Oscillospiraceae bacterium]